MEEIAIFWHRRDLRLEDNHGLYQALQSGYKVLPLFIFDWNILHELPDSEDARVLFLHQETARMKEQLEEWGSSLLIKYGKPLNVWNEILQEYNIKEVYCNRDYEPYAQNRDREIYDLLKERGIDFKGYKDQVIFEKNEVLKGDGKPYTVFTPYSRKYRDQLTDQDLASYPSWEQSDNYLQIKPLPSVALEEMGFRDFEFSFPDRKFDREIIRNYHKTRDIPSIKGTTRLSVHLRFGTISIRQLSKVAREVNPKFFTELIWRDFYQAILYHFPQSLDRSFKPEYDLIEWENNEEHFEKWCAGQTGYPLVDAGMRELNATGYMHNRIRMLTASFLTKHLLIDWRWGEAYFAQKLLDYEAGSNVGGWQWAAGSGVDAAPYFRIFSPDRQQERFDKDYRYVKQWVPEYGTDRYPERIVDHKEARQRALDRYKAGISSN